MPGAHTLPIAQPLHDRIHAERFYDSSPAAQHFTTVIFQYLSSHGLGKESANVRMLLQNRQSKPLEKKI